MAVSTWNSSTAFKLQSVYMVHMWLCMWPMYARVEFYLFCHRQILVLHYEIQNNVDALDVK